MGFASCSRGLVFPDGDNAGPNSNTFDPSLEYSTDMVLLWQPPSYFPPWSPASFAVDEVPYLCAEQYMMAEYNRFSTTIGQWSSSCPRLVQAQANTWVKAGATLTLVLEREKQNAVLSGTYAKFTQNPAITKNRLLSCDNNLLAEYSPLDPVWGVGLRTNGPRANTLCQRRA